MTHQEILSPRDNVIANGFSANQAEAHVIDQPVLDQYVTTLNNSEPGTQQSELIRFLIKNRLLASILSDPNKFDQRRAIQLSFSAMREDLDFDRALISVAIQNKGITAADVERLLRTLAILEQTCSKDQLMDCLTMIDNPAGRVRSRIALILGRVTRDADRFQALMKDADPRVRANLVEGVSHAWPSLVSKLLRESTFDSHHRVASNAALALYKLGDVGSISCISSLLRDPREMHARAGLWAAGQTKDFRFEKSVADLMVRPEPEVQTSANRIGDLLRAERAMQVFVGGVKVRIIGAGVLSSSIHFVRFQCIQQSGQRIMAASDTGALSFALQENGTAVEQFTMRPITAAEPLVFLLVVSRMSGGLSDQLRTYWQKPLDGESLAILCAEQGELCKDVLSSSTFEESLAAEVVSLESRTVDAPILTRYLHCLGSFAGRKHCIIIVDGSFADAPSDYFVQSTQQAAITVHVFLINGVSPQIADAYQHLASLTGGRFVPFGSASELGELLSELRAEHSSTIELSWAALSDAPAEVALTYCGEFGFGSATVQLLK